MVLSNHSKKMAPNQADNISIFQLCLLLKMRLSVDLEGRFTGYKCIIFFQNKNYFLFRRFGKREPNPIWMTRLVSLIYIACLFFRCPRNWVRYIQSCYKFTRSPIKRWDDARLQCQAYRHQDSDNSGMKFNIKVPTK